MSLGTRQKMKLERVDLRFTLLKQPVQLLLRLCCLRAMILCLLHLPSGSLEVVDAPRQATPRRPLSGPAVLLGSILIASVDLGIRDAAP